MRIEIHHRYPQLEQKLDAILHKLNKLESRMANAEDTLDAITAKLANQSSVEDGIIALLADIKNKLSEALRGEVLSAGAQAKLAAIMPLLEANTGKLSDAIVANTDAAPAPTPVPDPTPVPAPSTNPGTFSSGGFPGPSD